MTLQTELELALRLATEAGEIAVQAEEEGLQINKKDGGEPVTSADQRSNQHILAGIERQFPDDGILSEERADDSQRLGRPRTWIIDPVDGTEDLLRGSPEFAVHIALAIDHELALGVVHAPRLGISWLARRGQGAHVLGGGELRPLRLPAEPEAHQTIMALSRHHSAEAAHQVMAALGLQRTLVCGSIGVKLGRICDGDAQLYVNGTAHTKEWDTAAPEIVLREAGGQLTDLAGEPLRYNRPDPVNRRGVCAGAPDAHRRALAVLPNTPSAAELLAASPA